MKPLTDEQLMQPCKIFNLTERVYLHAALVKMMELKGVQPTHDNLIDNSRAGLQISSVIGEYGMEISQDESSIGDFILTKDGGITCDCPLCQMLREMGKDENDLNNKIIPFPNSRRQPANPDNRRQDETGD